MATRLRLPIAPRTNHLSLNTNHQPPTTRNEELNMCEFTDKVEAAQAVIASLSPEQARRLESGVNVVFVDPRPAEAIKATTGLIQGASRVPLEDIEAGRLPDLLEDRSVHVITSCQAGPMGAIAAHALRKHGFKNVNYIDGGTQSWVDAGYPVTH
jgi:rhodanese-related sulfurtransferase